MWWFQEIFPKWLTLTYGQAAIGTIMGTCGFLFVNVLDMETLRFWIAVWVGFKLFLEGCDIVKTRPDEPEAESE